MSEPRPSGAIARPAAITAAVFGVAWAWLSLRPSAPIHPDSSRDLAFARDLVDGAELHASGAWASFATLEQGTTWVDVLALIELAGFDRGGTEAVLTALLAATVALTYLGLRALVGAGAGLARELPPLAGALGLLAMIPIVIEVPILWQPLLLPLPIVLAHLCLWRVLRDGAVVDAVAFAVFAALALDVHVVSFAFVVPALVAIPLASERPVAASAASLATLAATLAVSSRVAWADNLEVLRAKGWVLPGVLVLVAILAAGALLRRRFAALDDRRRLLAALVVELALLAGLALASLPAFTPELAGRYIGPFVPVVALGLTLLAEGSRSRSFLALAVGVGLVLASLRWLRPAESRDLPLAPQWTMAEFDPIAEAIVARELTWTELVGRVQGPDHAALIGYFSTLVPAGSPEPPPADGGLLIVALAPADAAAVEAEIPAHAIGFELEVGRAFVIETPARADRYASELCTDAGCEAVTLAITRRVDQAHPNAWIGHGVAVFMARDASEQPLDSIVWRLPIHAGPEVVALLTSNLSERCAWRFVEVDGFEVDAALPSHELALPAGAQGQVFVGRELPRANDGGEGDPKCFEAETLPPSIVELDPAWVRLRALLQPAWARAE